MQAIRRATLADVVGSSAWTKDAILIAIASLATGLLSQAEIRLPFTPVPVTLQPLAVFLTGAALGSRRGALAMLAYLAEGAAGLPFFAGGAAGPQHLIGPTGGYLFGFVGAAAVIGALAERGWDRTPLRAFAAMLLGSVVLFSCGVAQLSLFTGAARAIELGLLPFLAGDVLKMALAAALLPGVWKLLERTGLTPRL